MKISLTFKQKMAFVLGLAIVGFAIVTTLAVNGMTDMSAALVRADSVAHTISEASQFQLTLLKYADDGRVLTSDGVDTFLGSMDKALEEHDAGIKKVIPQIEGTSLADDMTWMLSAATDFKNSFHRLLELKTKIGFDNENGLRKELIDGSELLKKEIWFGAFSELILKLQVDVKAYAESGAPELVAVIKEQIDKIQAQLIENSMDTLKSTGGVDFNVLVAQFGEQVAGFSGPRSELFDVEKHIAELLDSIKKRSDVIKTNGENLLNQSNADAMSKKDSALTLMISGAAVIGILLALVLIWISVDFLKSLKQVIGVVNRIADGDVQIDVHTGRKDEIGLLLRAMAVMVGNLKEVCHALDALAVGDLSFQIETDAHKKDELRKALLKVRNDLSAMVGQQIVAAQKISSGSVNVSDFSQTLSQGATESAASLEEITSSLNEMAGQTRVNADHADQVNLLSSEAKSAAEEGNAQMERMVAAMTEISDAGQSINKIIKVIDEIAFQTNLLALNAAVEAARAGQHGKGFAVVAEEVRNLAARSAKAASETSELIAGSVAKTQNGVDIASLTARSLAKIFSGVSKVSDLAEEIAVASREQSTGIGQINEGLGQIDSVIQQNTATAEESAAAAEELSGQSAELMSLLQRFQLDDSPTGGQISIGYQG